MTFTFIVEVSLEALLAVTLCYCILLERRLAAVRKGQEGLARTIGELNMAISGAGASFFSDADTLSLMFATTLRPMYPNEFKTSEPDWILPSPWLRLTPDVEARVNELAASGRYERVDVETPRLLWQNNPDPLFRDFAPKLGPLALFHRRVGSQLLK